MEDEISKQHCLWTAQQQPNSESIPRTIEPSPEHVQVINGHHKPLVPLQEEEAGNGSIFSDPVTSPRAATAFQPAQRPPTVGPPPKFGQFQGNMPPRPTTALPHDRRTANAWNLVAPMQGGRQGSFNHRPQFQGPHFGRAPSRQGFQSNPQFRTSFPQSAFAMPENPPQRPSSAFSYGRDHFHNTPTGQSRGRYGGRLRDNAPPPPLLDFGASSAGGPASGPPNALVSRNPYSNQPITITEQAVQAWHGNMMHFYATIRHFVECHANNPDPTGETKLSQTQLWPILLATYYPLSEQAAESYLDHHIRSENSKSCIVTRVVIDFVVNRVWNPSAWAGADADSTYGIMEVERDLERTTGDYSASSIPP